MGSVVAGVRGLGRWLARILLMAAAALFGLDIAISMEKSNIFIRSIADWLAILTPRGRNALESALGGKGSVLWDPVALFLLSCPLWLLLAALAWLLFRLSRRPLARGEV